MSAAAIIEGIATILSEQAKQRRTEYVAYENVAVEVETGGKKIKFVVNGSVYRTAWSKAPPDDAQQAPAPDDAEQQAPAPDDAEQQAPAPDAEQQAPADDAEHWDQEPVLDMGRGQVTVMARWLRYKKLLRERPDVVLWFLNHIDATCEVSWPTIRPPATGGAARVPLALCCWFLEQVDQANDGRLEAALALIDARLADIPGRLDAAKERLEARARSIDKAPRDAEGDKPQSGWWTPTPEFTAFLAKLRAGNDVVDIAYRAHITAAALRKLEKGTTHKKFPRSALIRLATVYGVDATKMLKKAGSE